MQNNNANANYYISFPLIPDTIALGRHSVGSENIKIPFLYTVTVKMAIHDGNKPKSGFIPLKGHLQLSAKLSCPQKAPRAKGGSMPQRRISVIHGQDCT